MVTRISLRATLAELEPGKSLTIPVGMRSYSGVRNTASLLAFELGRKYTTHADREAGTITITRVS